MVYVGSAPSNVLGDCCIGAEPLKGGYIICEFLLTVGKGVGVELACKKDGVEALLTAWLLWVCKCQDRYTNRCAVIWLFCWLFCVSWNCWFEQVSIFGPVVKCNKFCLCTFRSGVLTFGNIGNVVFLLGLNIVTVILRWMVSGASNSYSVNQQMTVCSWCMVGTLFHFLIEKS